MGEKQLKKIAALSICFMVLVLSTAVFSSLQMGLTVYATEDSVETSDQHNEDYTNEPVYEYADNTDSVSGPAIRYTYQLTSPGTPVVDALRWNELREELTGDKWLLLAGIGGGAKVQIEDLYMNNSVRIIIDNYNEEEYAPEYFQRVIGDRYYIGKPDKNASSDVVKKVSVVVSPSVEYPGSNTVSLLVKFDHIYACTIKQYDDVCCVELRKPHDVYSNIIVVDAGHGGTDEGCSTADRKYIEKNFTLDMTKRLKKLLDGANIKTYYTRIDDTGLALRQRVGLANELEADMFVSIHCNYYERYWVSGVNGVETLYSSEGKKVKKSRILARNLLESVGSATGMRKRGVIDRKKDLHILRESMVPAAIIEAGYMSDKGDIKFFTNAKKTDKLVKGLYDGIVAAYNEIYGTTIQ